MPLTPLLPRLLLVALAYYLSGRIGLTLSSYGSQVTLIWPPTGIALFALLAWGYRVAPAIWLAALLVNLHMGTSSAAALVIATGNTLGPVLAVYALRRFGFNRDLRAARDVFLYIAIAALGGMAINASIGTAALVLGGMLPLTITYEVWLTWWLGDALGAMLVGPALLTLLPPLSGALPGHLMSRREQLIAWSALIGVGLLTTSPLSPLREGQSPYLAFPFLAWFALRADARQATWATLCLAGLAVWGVVLGHGGPFVKADGSAAVIHLWSFMFTLVLATLLITALRGESSRALDEIRRSEARLKEAERLALIGNWERDLGSGQLTWSDEIFRILEIDPAGVGANHEAFLASIHPEDREKVDTAYKRCRERREPYRLDYRLLMPDGRLKHLHEECKTYHGADGKPLRSVGTVQDVSAFVRLRDALKDERDFAEGLIETAQAVILVLDAEGRIVRYNAYLEALSGQPLATMKGKDWMDHFLPERDRERIRAVFAEASAGVQSRGKINAILTRAGEERLIEWYDKPLRDAAGKTIGVLAIGYDVTQRIATEKELEQHRRNLEGMVAERTRQLEQALATAEAANRAKTVFLANMSHELRTPLNAILGFAQLLERDARIPDDARRSLATINRAGSHLLALINDVLEISRIEAGRTGVVRAAFDLAATLATVTEMTRPRAEAKGLVFTISHPDPLPNQVVGDGHHLRQVLINLLGNAIKYTDQGQVSLNVSVLPAQTLRFEVGDTGPGIAPDEQGHLFQAFYQTRDGIAKGEGTGLGLAISREFVRLMGGELILDSAPGKGSRFSFTLPLPATDDVPLASNGHRVVGLAAGQTSPRILVAEDHPDNQQVVTQLLEQVGCQVRIAQDGHEAIELFQSWRPQLILMDMRMPVMDGYAATRAIRALAGGDKLPIVALTASAFEEDRGKILAAGCDEMVCKPFEEARLFDVIGRLLGLCFEYAQPSQARATPVANDLSALPAWIRQSLADTAITLDKEAILAIVERLRPEHPEEAELITGLVEDYRFDTIEALSK